MFGERAVSDCYCAIVSTRGNWMSGDLALISVTDHGLPTHRHVLSLLKREVVFSPPL